VIVAQDGEVERRRHAGGVGAAGMGELAVVLEEPVGAECGLEGHRHAQVGERGPHVRRAGFDLQRRAGTYLLLDARDDEAGAAGVDLERLGLLGVCMSDSLSIKWFDTRTD
jgi:hypothetical protein